MTSPYVRPDLEGIVELERLLGHLAEELAAWRRRCQKAETEVLALKSQGGMIPGNDMAKARGRLLDVERENHDLRGRVDQARELVGHLQQRLAFLEDEASSEPAR